MRNIASTITCAGLLLACGAALAAPHGKPGLWTVTTSMTMANMPQIPPEALAAMKARGMQMPGMGEPMTRQMCMTQEQVNMEKPPVVNDHGENCTTKVLSQTSSSVSAEVTCHGHMEGVGHSEMSWRGDSHYEGTYAFKGTMEGRPNEINTKYSGDFVKADCGAVKPFAPPPRPQ